MENDQVCPSSEPASTRFTYADLLVFRVSLLISMYPESALLPVRLLLDSTTSGRTEKMTKIL